MIINSNLPSATNLSAPRTGRGKSISQDSAAVGAQAELTAPEQLPVSDTNLTAVGSPIEDEESAKQNTESVMSVMLAQSATAMLAQANLKPQSALRLLQQ